MIEALKKKLLIEFTQTESKHLYRRLRTLKPKRTQS